MMLISRSTSDASSSASADRSIVLIATDSGIARMPRRRPLLTSGAAMGRGASCPSASRRCAVRAAQLLVQRVLPLQLALPASARRHGGDGARQVTSEVRREEFRTLAAACAVKKAPREYQIPCVCSATEQRSARCIRSSEWRIDRLQTDAVGMHDVARRKCRTVPARPTIAAALARALFYPTWEAAVQVLATRRCGEVRSTLLAA